MLSGSQANDEFVAELKAVISGKYIARDRLFIQTKSGYYGVSKAILEDPDGRDQIVSVKLNQPPVIRSPKKIIEYALILSELDHENVVKMIGISFDQDLGIPLVIKPWHDNGGLLSYLRDDSIDKTNQQLINWAIDIARGLEYLHSKQIVHRFPATRCCVLDDFMAVKITGFAYAKRLDEDGTYKTDEDEQIPIKWIAPDVLVEESNLRNYSEASDVWAFAVTLWQITNYGENPYDDTDRSELFTLIKNGLRLPDCGADSCGMCDLMTKCWSLESTDRPKFSEILNTLCNIADAMSN